MFRHLSASLAVVSHPQATQERSQSSMCRKLKIGRGLLTLLSTRLFLVTPPCDHINLTHALAVDPRSVEESKNARQRDEIADLEAASKRILQRSDNEVLAVEKDEARLDQRRNHHTSEQSRVVELAETQRLEREGVDEDPPLGDAEEANETVVKSGRHDPHNKGRRKSTTIGAATASNSTSTTGAGRREEENDEEASSLFTANAEGASEGADEASSEVATTQTQLDVSPQVDPTRPPSQDDLDPLSDLEDTFSILGTVAQNALTESETDFLKERRENKRAVKDLWPPNAHDIITFSLVAIGLLIAACGGIGGGAFLVPLYIMILQFPTGNATALSNVTIFGGSIANALFNLRKKTDRGSPLIDWDIILLMEPSTILGAVAGTLVNKVLPSFALQCMLTGILLYMGQNTLEKGFKRLRQEQQQASTTSGTSPSSNMLSIPTHHADPLGGTLTLKPMPSRDPRSITSPPAPTYPLASGTSSSRSTSSSASPTTEWWGSTNGDHNNFGQEQEGQGGDPSHHAPPIKITAPNPNPSKQFDAEGLLGPAPVASGGSANPLLIVPAEPLSSSRMPSSREVGKSSASQWAKFLAFMPLYIIGLVLQVVRGDGHKFQPVAECGTVGYWALTLLNIPVIVFFLWLYRRHILADLEAAKAETGYHHSSGAIPLSARSSGTSSSVSSVTSARCMESQLFNGTSTVASHQALDGTSTVASHQALDVIHPEQRVAAVSVTDASAAFTTPKIGSGQAARNRALPPSATTTAISSGVSSFSGSGVSTPASAEQILNSGKNSKHRSSPDSEDHGIGTGTRRIRTNNCSNNINMMVIDEGAGTGTTGVETTRRPGLLAAPPPSTYAQSPPPQAASLPSDTIQWDRRNTITYPAICTAAGLMAGMFGVGGGIVKGPLMLALGVEPKVASATAATMIFFTSSTACVCYLLFNVLYVDYSLFAFTMGFTFTMIGQGVIAKTFASRQAPVILSMAAVICISSIAVGVQATRNYFLGHGFEFNNLCSAGGGNAGEAAGPSELLQTMVYGQP
ncbi:unnamed protein product [Amoebophrya sp. A25]|nr:unnamed protein product [Amoebophrya sp. A25]|eukprot:GSA25T00005551001.1